MKKGYLGCLIFLSSFIFIAACTTETTDNGDDATAVEVDALIESYEEEQLVLEQRIVELEQNLEQREAQLEALQEELDRAEGENGGQEQDTPRPFGEGFYEQHWMYFLKKADNPLGHEPGTTDWRPYSGDGGQGFSEGESTFAAPGDLVYEWIGEATIPNSWGEVDETAVRVRQDGEDAAEAIILHWGFKDDSIRGTDYLLEMRQSDNVWYIESIEERNHCGRGVTEDDICL
ncbi:MAG: hypothetical protein LRY73_01105 [Bacillus sp. (in: Bacteria)]|nr:hypothetical protein [Bacillus sp. (in: firmicutes)]